MSEIEKEYCVMEGGAMIFGWRSTDGAVLPARQQAERDIRYLHDNLGIHVENFELNGVPEDLDQHWSCSLVQDEDIGDMDEVTFEELISKIEGAGFCSATWLQ
jgi:hypothetical protein